MHLSRACEPGLLAACCCYYWTVHRVLQYEQKCHEAFSHADVAPAALEWSPPSPPSHPPCPPSCPLQQRAPATCHLPPCLPHVMICCSHPVLEGATRPLPGATMHHSFKVFFCPDAPSIATFDPRIYPLPRIHHGPRDVVAAAAAAACRQIILAGGGQQTETEEEGKTAGGTHRLV